MRWRAGWRIPLENRWYPKSIQQPVRKRHLRPGARQPCPTRLPRALRHGATGSAADPSSSSPAKRIPSSPGKTSTAGVASIWPPMCERGPVLRMSMGLPVSVLEPHLAGRPVRKSNPPARNKATVRLTARSTRPICRSGDSSGPASMSSVEAPGLRTRHARPGLLAGAQRPARRRYPGDSHSGRSTNSARFPRRPTRTCPRRRWRSCLNSVLRRRQSPGSTMATRAYSRTIRNSTLPRRSRRPPYCTMTTTARTASQMDTSVAARSPPTDS